MSSLAERITADTTAAMKARDAVRLSTLRLLRSEIKYAEIANLRPATDEDVLAVIRKAVKQRQDAIEQYERGGRPEMAAQEAAEAAILQSYLPATLDTSAIRQVVRDVIAQSGASGPPAMGTVMRAAMEQLRDRADGRAIQAVVREELAAHGG
jgi:uncharacterized protein YqeY